MKAPSSSGFMTGGTSLVPALFGVLLLSGCGPDGATGRSTDEPGLVFRLANELQPADGIWDASALFAEEIEKASPDGRIAEGEIRVVLYDQGMVGTERQLLENVYFGVMEVVQINSAVVSTIDPAYNIFDLPYLFVSDAHHKAVLNGEIGDRMLERLRGHDMLGLGFFGLGFRDMFYRMPDGGCVTTPEDLGGLKMRVIESPIMIAGINALGASATPVPFSELFQALRTGVVDGADNGARIFTATRFYETGTDCFTRTEHFTNQHVLVANEDWFEGLEPKYRERISAVARSIVPEFDRRWERATEEAFAEMATHGVTVNDVDDKGAFMARVEDLPDQFFDDYPEVPRELYERIRALGESYR
jgi:TRAP-type C4-dicarboxylate transport system substrate-binding protein